MLFERHLNPTAIELQSVEGSCEISSEINVNDIKLRQISRFSAMDTDKKTAAFDQWQQRWDVFIDDFYQHHQHQ